jgi:hypothetical protein
MTCREVREELMEWARGAEPRSAVRVHVSACSACAGILERQRALTEAFRGVAMAPIPPAEQFSGRILGEFDRSARVAGMRLSGWLAAGGLAAAAALLLLVSPNKPAAPVAQDASQFIAIPYTVPLSPEERATVVRMRIPVTALLAAGFRMAAADPAATVQADVLVSQDGRARAIRPISISSTD